MEKWRVFVGLILMLSMGSAVCSKLIAFCAPPWAHHKVVAAQASLMLQLKT